MGQHSDKTIADSAPRHYSVPATSVARDRPLLRSNRSEAVSQNRPTGIAQFTNFTRNSPKRARRRVLLQNDANEKSRASQGNEIHSIGEAKAAEASRDPVFLAQRERFYKACSRRVYQN
jgi:hypothetical protein